ncbi:MAG: hypothetical protein ACMXYC_01050 [Candidatus Woesearchaeota archaeon]
MFRDFFTLTEKHVKEVYSLKNIILSVIFIYVYYIGFPLFYGLLYTLHSYIIIRFALHLELMSVFFFCAALLPFFIIFTTNGYFSKELENKSIQYSIPYVSRILYGISKLCTIASLWFIIISVIFVSIGLRPLFYWSDFLLLYIFMVFYAFFWICCNACSSVCTTTIERSLGVTFIAILLGVTGIFYYYNSITHFLDISIFIILFSVCVLTLVYITLLWRKAL